MAEFPCLPLWTDAYLADTTHLSTIEHGAYLLLLIAMWRSKDKRLPNDDVKLSRFARLRGEQWARMKPDLMPFFDISDDGLTITQGRLSDEADSVRRHSRKQADRARSRWSNGDGSGGGGSGGMGHDDSSAVHRTPPSAVHGSGSAAVPRETDKPLKSPDSNDAAASPSGCPLTLPLPSSLTTVSNDTSVKEALEPLASSLDRYSSSSADEFERVWSAYPRKVGKGNAAKAWAKARRSTEYETIAAPLRLFVRAVTGSDPQFVPHLATWLNGCRWHDEQDHAANRPRTSTADLENLSRISSADDLAALMRDPEPATPNLRLIR